MRAASITSTDACIAVQAPPSPGAAYNSGVVSDTSPGRSPAPVQHGTAASRVAGPVLAAPLGACSPPAAHASLASHAAAPAPRAVLQAVLPAEQVHSPLQASPGRPSPAHEAAPGGAPPARPPAGTFQLPLQASPGRACSAGVAALAGAPPVRSPAAQAPAGTPKARTVAGGGAQLFVGSVLNSAPGSGGSGPWSPGSSGSAGKENAGAASDPDSEPRRAPALRCELDLNLLPHALVLFSSSALQRCFACWPLGNLEAGSQFLGYLHTLMRIAGVAQP